LKSKINTSNPLTFAAELRPTLTILLCLGIFLQPLGRILSMWQVHNDHYYTSISETVRGKAIVYCGDEKSLAKKVAKDAHKKSSQKQTFQNSNDFSPILNEYNSIQVIAYSSAKQLLYPPVDCKVQRGHFSIFQPPKV
jgi:hypothetical protein